jgi:hypothetical protein
LGYTEDIFYVDIKDVNTTDIDSVSLIIGKTLPKNISTSAGGLRLRVQEHEKKLSYCGEKSREKKDLGRQLNACLNGRCT